jgi:hypothetical protein
VTDNLVEILIGAKDTATPDLDALKARLDELGRKVETAKVGLDGTKESEAELLRINAMLAALGNRTTAAKIKVDGGAKAAADIAALELRLDRLGSKTGEVRGAFSRLGEVWSASGIFGKLLTPIRAVIIGLQGIVQAAAQVVIAFLQGGLTGAAGSLGEALATGGQSALVMAAGLAAMTVAAAALGIVLGPFLADLTLATAGFGIFAAAAVPEIEKVWKAVDAGPKAIAKLSPAERQLAGPIESLKNEFGKLEKAIRPEVLQAFGTGLKILKDVMPALKPLAEAAGKAFDGLLKDIDKWVNSPSGKKFIHWMETEGPVAIRTFGRVAWDVIQGVGKTLHFLYDVGMTFLGQWKRTWHDAAVAVDDARKFIDTDTAVQKAALRDLAATAHMLAGAWSAVWNSMKTDIQAAYNFIAGIVSKIEGVLSGLNGALGGLPGKVLGSLTSMFASGGVVGAAAAGGPRSGWTLVGEMGPELVRIPPGTQVMNNAATAAMLAGGGGGGNSYQITVNVPVSAAPAAVGRSIVEAIKEFERGSGTRWRTA